MGKYIKPKGKDGQRADTKELKRLRGENKQLVLLVKEAYFEGYGEKGIIGNVWAEKKWGKSRTLHALEELLWLNIRESLSTRARNI